MLTSGINAGEKEYVPDVVQSFMDLVEGATLSKTVTHGRMMNEDRSFIYVPEEVVQARYAPLFTGSGNC